MRGRFEGFEKYGRIVLCVTVLLFYHLCGSNLLAQNFSKTVMRYLERKVEEGVEDATSLAEYWEYIMANPVDVNSASQEDFLELPLMTVFMAGSLVAYRQSSGPIQSWAELSLVHGFDEEIVRELKPFLTIRDGGFKGENVYGAEGLKHDFIFKSRLKLTEEDGGLRPVNSGLPASIYARYRLECGGQSSMGFTMESDMGERYFPDFFSFYLNVKDIPFVRDLPAKISSLTVGDYSLRFGQGLVLWNSFSMSGTPTVSSLIKYGGKILPYRSVDENKFFRGAAISFSIGKYIESSLFFSINRHDALTDNNAFYSLPTNLLHYNEKSMAAKHKLREFLIGGNVSITMNKWKFGVTAVAYRFDKEDRRKKHYYDENLRYDGWWCDFSADVLYSTSGMRVFGEAALDRRAAFAALCGVALPIGDAFELSCLLRYYDPKFISRHAGAVCSLGCNNELGTTAVFRWSPIRKLVFSLSGEYVHFPGSRYGVRDKSDRIKFSGDCQWNVTQSHEFFFGGKYEWDNGRNISRTRLRLDYSYCSDMGLSSSSRFECSILHRGSGGWLMYEELAFKLHSQKFSVALRCTVFCVDDWNARIYCYEKDLPNSFSVPAFFGNGVGGYLLIKCRPWNFLSLGLRCSFDYYWKGKTNDFKSGVFLTLLF